MFKKHGVDMFPCDDTMLMSYTVDGTSHSNSMDGMSQLFFDHQPIKFDEVAGKGKKQVTFDRVDLDKARDYAAEDADITHRLHHLFKPRIAREKMAVVYEDIERPLVPVIGQMELHGIKVDPIVLKEMSEDFGKKIISLEKKIQKEAGTEFNVGSPKQIGEVLFDQMGLEGGKKTKTGQWSTDVGTLEKLSAQGHDVVTNILEWRGLSKLKSTYTDALQEQINPDTGRVHTSFSMAGTSTGRLASSDPNLQNIPIRTEDGRKIREAFVADKGNVLLAVDYSQVELRLAAEMAGVKALKQAFKDDVDIHALTASQVFGVPLDEVDGNLRRQAKAVNFGIIYGISGWGLAKQLDCDPGDAHEFIRKYLDTFHEIETFMEKQKEFARKHEYVQTLFGRKCYTPNINAKMQNVKMGAERAAINAPLQGTAADIMKMAMIKMPDALTNAKLDARMLLQVHDELIFEVPENQLEETSALVKSVMENVVQLDVPLTIKDFIKHESTSGLLLILAAAIALTLNNSSLAWIYDGLLNTPMVIQIGAFEIAKPLLLWINDGLMAIFFFLIGLEVKREILVGELSSKERALLPIIAAIGGLAVPALIFYYFNQDNPEALRGWAVPTATDIAFALGVLALIGKNIPSSLKIMLLSIAIIDDIAAVLIIAIFYTAETSVISMGLAGIGLLVAIGFNMRGITRITPYILVGVFMWYYGGSFCG